MMCPQPTGDMSSRKRFRETMRYGEPDHVPYFEEGIRQNVPFENYAYYRKLLAKITQVS